jgi:hypothetical protein
MTRGPARIGRGACLAVLVAVAGTPSLAADDAALTVVDLAAYRAALSGQRGAREPPALVGFRELWNHPATYQGSRVQIQGRLVRRFRQGSFGTFPPLEEAWVFSPAGDPFCLVFPATQDPEEREAGTKRKTPGAAGSVRFAGTFLKLLEYQGADGPRRAPLIVGPSPPVAVTVALDQRKRQTGVAERPLTRLDWTIALAAAVAVALVLAHQHLRRPIRRPLEMNDSIASDLVFDDALAPRRSEP